jgi:hypothetical protein
MNMKARLLILSFIAGLPESQWHEVQPWHQDRASAEGAVR